MILLLKEIYCEKKQLCTRNISVSSSLLIGATLSISLMMIGILIKIIFFGEETSFLSFSIPIKFLIIVFLSVTLRIIDYSKISYKTLSVIIALPLIISILMYLFPPIDSFFTHLYGIMKFPKNTRFGGIYGKDVNTMGLYCSLCIIIHYYLFFYKKINIVFFAFDVILSLFCTLLCGMRTGMITVALTIFAIIIVNLHTVLIKIKFTKLIRYAFLFSAIMLISVVIINNVLSDNFIENLSDRFSFSHLNKDLSYTETGNLNTAITYWYSCVSKCKSRSVFFGYDISQSYVDMGYLDVFIRHGILGLISVFLFALSIVIEIYSKIGKNHVLFLVIYSIIISIKGIFVSDMKYLFVVTFLIFFMCSVKQNSEVDKDYSVHIPI